MQSGLPEVLIGFLTSENQNSKELNPPSAKRFHIPSALLEPHATLPQRFCCEVALVFLPCVKL